MSPLSWLGHARFFFALVASKRGRPNSLQQHEVLLRDGASPREPLSVEFHGVWIDSDAGPDRRFLALLYGDLVERLVAHTTLPLYSDTGWRTAWLMATFAPYQQETTQPPMRS